MLMIDQMSSYAHPVMSLEIEIAVRDSWEQKRIEKFMDNNHIS